MATSYFLTQKKLMPKQDRWQASLVEFKFILEYKPSKANLVVDELSYKAQLVAITQPSFPLVDQINEGLDHDSQDKNLMNLAKQGNTHQFWLKDGLIHTKGKSLLMPKWGRLRKKIIKECHNSLWMGLPGVHHTLTLVERAYNWPQMREDMELYVRTCLVCRQDKVEQN